MGGLLFFRGMSLYCVHCAGEEGLFFGQVTDNSIVVVIEVADVLLFCSVGRLGEALFDLG